LETWKLETFSDGSFKGWAGEVLYGEGGGGAQKEEEINGGFEMIEI
jgi:hypothetical protein